MKKYRFCFLLFLASSLICIGAGYAAAKYAEKQKETENLKELENLPPETASEEFMADDNPSEKEAQPANKETSNKYYLVCEDGFLLVFCKDKTTVCLYTHVPITDFPEEEQGRLRSGIWFSSMMDIFSYLESYTS